MKKSEIIIEQILIDIYYIINDLSSNFDQSWKKKEEDRKVQGVKGESGKSLSSKFGRNQCLY